MMKRNLLISIIIYLVMMAVIALIGFILMRVNNIQDASVLHLQGKIMLQSATVGAVILFVVLFWFFIEDILYRWKE